MPGKGAVWLASYPKSGNTWLRLLLANLLSGHDRPVPINQIDLPAHSLMSRRAIEQLTLIDTSLLTRAETEHMRPVWTGHLLTQATERAYIKTHDHYRRNTAGQGLFGNAVGMSALYVVRDPRDVAISTAHHLGCSLDKAIDVLNHGTPVSCEPHRYSLRFDEAWAAWRDHVTGWLDQNDLPLHSLRYEDLLADTVQVFGATARFLGLEFEPDVLERAVGFSAFEQVQRQEREGGFGERIARSTAPFFRSGRAGAWVDVLTPAQADRIVKANRSVMERLGYL